jgi:hypothetical protein
MYIAHIAVSIDDTVLITNHTGTLKYHLERNKFVSVYILFYVNELVFIHCEISGFHCCEHKVGVPWDFALYSLTEVERCFRGAYCLHQLHYSDGGGSKLL